MKKKVLSLAVLMASVFTFGAMAQTSVNANDNNCASAKTECTKGSKGDKKCKQDMKGRKADRPNPFEGINLTAEQQSKLQAIRNSAKQQRQAVKSEKMQADSVARAARKADMTKKRQDYLVQIKEVLTPEQYVVFLENSYVQQAPMHKKGFDKMAKGDRGKAMKADKNRKGMHGDKRNGQRPARLAQNAAK